MKENEMSIYKQFGTNTAKEIEGVDVTFEANEDGTIPTFRIARAGRGNKKYTKALEAATRPHRRQIQLETLPEATAEKLSLEVFANTILLGWTNVLDNEGKQITYNRENAIKLMTDLPYLYEELQVESSKAARFREDQTEAEAKN